MVKFKIFGFKFEITKQSESSESVSVKKEDRETGKRLSPITKKVYRERKVLITAYLSDYNKQLSEESAKQYEKDVNFVNAFNSVCPKCGSKNVVNQIRTANGNTVFVNKCKDCENEWKSIEAAKHYHVLNVFDSFESVKPILLFDKIKRYLELEFDPDNVKEEYDSMEEKREALLMEYPNSNNFTKYRDIPRYMLDYVVWEGMNDSLSDMDYVINNPIWGVGRDTDAYSYIMPDDIFEICKKVVGWKGGE